MLKESGSALEVIGMSSAQETALAALRGGSSFARAAQEAGVNRATVYRWLQREPAFRAAYNAWQRELAESGHARLLKLTERAVEVVAEALEAGDREIAFKMLRDMGVLRSHKRGSTDEQVLKLQMHLKKGRELQRAEGNMLDYLMEKMGVSPRDRRRMLDGRGSPELIQRLRAATSADARSGTTTPANAANPTGATEPADAIEAANATTWTNPGQAPHGATWEAEPSVEDKLRPEQHIAQTTGATEEGPADATTRATKEGVSHEPAAEVNV